MTAAPASPFACYDVASLIAARAQQRGAHPLIVWAPFEGAGETWSYARFADEVARLAGGMAARGIRPGDRVLVHLENCPEMLLARFACAWLGAVCVATNAMAAGPEIAYFAETANAVAAVTQPKFAGLLAAHTPRMRWIAVTATDAGAPPAAGTAPARAESFAALFGEPLPRRAPDPDAAASIMYTTGTTGRPKGVVWTHANVLWGARLGALQQGIRADDVVQNFLPMFHVVGFSWTFLPALWAGATVVLQPRFSASRFWPVALEHRATVAMQVLFTINVLAQMPIPAHHFRQWGAARHDPAAQALFGLPALLGAWGMTEMVGQPIVGDPAATPRAHSLGRPSVAYDIHILDDDGRPVRAGEVGHLLVGGRRGLSIFAGYDGDAAATAEAFDEHGRFRTGDRVRLHEDGWIQFADRTKDIIKVGGEGVSAGEIEAVVARVPGVREVAVVAKPDATYGEVAAAFVILKPEISPEQAAEVPDQIRAECRAQMAKFKVPREIIVVADFPRVGFGKIAKAQLRERFQTKS
jgi:carnitine-CoA ligase